MTFQNRVHPTGTLHAIDVRGGMMGNRGGRFHRPQTRVLSSGRPWASKRWIACVLDFKGRQRTVWSEGYTELFFLDEATALAAGHRPCFECRRADAKRFQAAMQFALGASEGWSTAPKAKQMDGVLHAARTRTTKSLRPVNELPVGTFFYLDGNVAALTPTGVRFWSFEGYSPSVSVDRKTSVQVISPQPILSVLRAGYEPSWHTSAGISS